MLGKVTVSNRNQNQNLVNEVERQLLFIGKTANSTLCGITTFVNAQTDLATLFHVAPVEAKSKAKTAPAIDTLYFQVAAAQLNAGAGWQAVIAGVASDSSWDKVIESAIKFNDVEGIVICDPMTSIDDFNKVSATIAAMESKMARWMFALTTLAPITPAQSWADYIAAAKALVADFAGSHVVCTPSLFGNDLGILAGRLCSRAVTIADSPMRVKTGPLLGMGQPSVGKDGEAMPDTIFAELDKARFSVPQTYPGEAGWYWADGNTFDLETGDFKVIEHLRVALKASRNVYKIAIPTIADRSLNSSPNSVANNKRLYMKPLLIMAAPVLINNVKFPGEIEPPNDSAVEINWITMNKTEIYVTVRPIGCQKDITIGVGIDLSKDEQEE
ncbi:DUF2586 domain-containing protein [Shewanella sp. D64]|uniref:DUF2586 domain-containing protein n=1 Tax=unclassified Shewanella TaxID=196818 RepID=UPI0022BA3ED4|nr:MULTISPECIES: DUF2586 domain-containing protein [unclassified Shewanella]MEC4728843.1 DUF2586 domain-containing protein [Shewanella sp. D64]MEC4740717.1 DUF2586 domain-containing protein [Shewanella sp. E94]WBJ95324.1 DUF2586 domain-containing protein [Shewanella sp. MTB7]